MAYHLPDSSVIWGFGDPKIFMIFSFSIAGP